MSLTAKLQLAFLFIVSFQVLKMSSTATTARCFVLMQVSKRVNNSTTGNLCMHWILYICYIIYSSQPRIQWKYTTHLTDEKAGSNRIRTSYAPVLCPSKSCLN